MSFAVELNNAARFACFLTEVGREPRTASELAEVQDQRRISIHHVAVCAHVVLR